MRQNQVMFLDLFAFLFLPASTSRRAIDFIRVDKAVVRIRAMAVVTLMTGCQGKFTIFPKISTI
jgi:hypothetical protein